VPGGSLEGGVELDLMSRFVIDARDTHLCVCFKGVSFYMVKKWLTFGLNRGSGTCCTLTKNSY